MSHTVRPFRVVESPSAAARLDAALAFLESLPPLQPVTIVGASRGAADDLARELAVRRAATFGIHRLSLTQLAARTAMVALADANLTPGTWLAGEAVATRAAFESVRDQALSYLEPVASTPGFPRALARTLQELRLAGVASDVLQPLPQAGGDLAELLDRFERCFADAGTADRADLFRTAAAMLRQRRIDTALILLDLPVLHASDRALIAAAASGARAVLATVPHGDGDAVRALVEIGGQLEAVEDGSRHAVASLRRYLFTNDQPPEQSLDDSLELFSAPGEGRECVEIARRIHREARRGVRFDEIAVLIRSPHGYFGLLEHALRRADVPAWFDRGTRRPHPAGRAFLALLACAAEHASASRFAEYLSLGQVPSAGAPPAEWAASRDEVVRGEDAPADDESDTEMERAASEAIGRDDPVVAGTLRAPWRWEKLLVDAAVIGLGATRWHRRLDGYAGELHLKKREAERQDGPGSGRVRGLEQSLEQLDHLKQFALPIIDAIGEWPARATWGEWLDRFEQLVPRVLRTPAYVQRVLADLRPMAEVGPIALDEARRVLTERLLTVEAEPAARRFGRVFVATPQQVRGRRFRVVFVPGLAERMFPQKAREDPLLLDESRASLDAPLATERQWLESERLLLQLCAGAASERLYVSYPRIELSESRARVPSFYALDVMRAATGRLPDYESLEERARDVGNATLSWPAPASPGDAIDDQEHDLAVLRTLLDDADPATVKGHAHYLLELNERLRRSVIDRWARGQQRWSVSDGLTRVAAGTRAALAAQRLGARAYSLSALQKFSACPYQFVLSAIYRLQPLEPPEPLQRMDPLTRGSIFHDVQAQFFRRLQAQSALPVTPETIAGATAVLEEAIADVAASAYEQLAPAVERVWVDEVASIRRDLMAWLQHLAVDGQEWEPRYFELAFGAVPGERDPRSVREEVLLEGGFRLRGAIDLVEEHRQTKLLRVTDHKTGRCPDRIERTVVGGGTVLQPVLYGMAVERLLDGLVYESRLFYCTAVGGFRPHSIPINERTRTAGMEVLRVIDRAIETGFLAAAPAAEACGRCDYQPVCGSEVGRRVARKPQDRLADLLELRKQP